MTEGKEQGGEGGGATAAVEEEVGNAVHKEGAGTQDDKEEDEGVR